MLTSKQRKYLRGLAHPLRPVTQVGVAGISDGVIGAVSAALGDHELIKVRLLDPEDKRAMASQLADATSAELCGLVGHTVILYRRHPENPRIELPA